MSLDPSISDCKSLAKLKASTILVMKGEGDIENEPPQRITTLSILEKLELKRNQTFFKRAFSPLGKGSIRGSIFTLFAGTVGAGVLSLSYVTIIPKITF